MAKRIAVLVGSLRKDSLNRKMALSLSLLARPHLDLEIVDLSSLSVYNQDLDESPPEEWVKFRKKIKIADAVLFVTPEYNRSVPSVLKNAIDIGSRPYGQSAWNEKPGAAISVSPGAAGASVLTITYVNP